MFLAKSIRDFPLYGNKERCFSVLVPTRTASLKLFFFPPFLTFEFSCPCWLFKNIVLIKNINMKLICCRMHLLHLLLFILTTQQIKRSTSITEKYNKWVAGAQQFACKCSCMLKRKLQVQGRIVEHPVRLVMVRRINSTTLRFNQCEFCNSQTNPFYETIQDTALKIKFLTCLCITDLKSIFDIGINFTVTIHRHTVHTAHLYFASKKPSLASRERISQKKNNECTIYILSS